MAITFDAAAKLLILTTGTTELDVVDAYSRWKDWVLDNNAQHLPAFSAVGGETIDAVAGTFVPTYAFLINGWKVRPQESNHTLAVTNGILLVDGGGDPFVNTTGSYVVRINFQQPVQAITVSTEGGSAPSAETVAAAVWAHSDALTLQSRVLLAHKILRNKTVTDPGTGVMTVYDDDGTTVLVSAQMYEGVSTSQTYRGTGAERREMLA